MFLFELTFCSRVVCKVLSILTHLELDDTVFKALLESLLQCRDITQDIG